MQFGSCALLLLTVLTYTSRWAASAPETRVPHVPLLGFILQTLWFTVSPPPLHNNSNKNRKKNRSGAAFTPVWIISDPSRCGSCWWPRQTGGRSGPPLMLRRVGRLPRADVGISYRPSVQNFSEANRKNHTDRQRQRCDGSSGGFLTACCSAWSEHVWTSVRLLNYFNHRVIAYLRVIRY